MAEHNWLSRAPVLVVDLRAVFRRNRAHFVCLRFLSAGGSTSHVGLTTPVRHTVHYLFRRSAIEVLVVGLRVGAGMVDDAVPMIRGCVECIELQWNTAGIDDVVIRPGRDEHRPACLDLRPNAIEHRLTGPFLHAKELVELVNFRPDLFGWLQRHQDELAVLCRIKYSSKLDALDGEIFNVFNKSLHIRLLFSLCPTATFHAIQNRKHADPAEWRFELQLNLIAHGPQQDASRLIWEE